MSKAPRLRILALHSWRTSAKIFKEQVSPEWPRPTRFRASPLRAAMKEHLLASVLAHLNVSSARL
jgi:hypothetical protein